MKLNEKKFFELAKQNGFEAADLVYSHSVSTSVSIFHSEINSFTEHETISLNARGIVNGKFGAVSTEQIDKNTPQFLVDSIKETAKIIEKDEKGIIFKGSKKYHKKNLFNKAVEEMNVSDAIKTCLEIEKKLLAYDKRINEVVAVGYENETNDCYLTNTYGLKLKSKQGTYTYYCEITAKNGEEVRTGFKVFVSMDPSEFNVDNFVKEIAEDALKKLGSTQCKSKKYPVVFNPETASILLKCFLGPIDYEEVEKKSSCFVGKLNQQIASKKLNVVENGLAKNIFFDYFDDEGVAINKKDIIKKGVLQTYLYTLETAKKAGVEATGNGEVVGGKTHAKLNQIFVKPGRKSEEEIMSSIKEGVYITDLQGIHAGINHRSGNFSLQSSGFMIRDGKIAEPLSLITIADNLLNVFNNIKAIANNSKLIVQTAATCPSIYVKKISVTGK